MIKKEWQSFFKNRFLMIVIIGIISIPTIYTTIFLGSMWDPYGTLEDLPVAVVNLDKPVSFQNQTMDLGNQMTQSLKTDGTLDFYFVDQTTALEGLEKGTYYMVITIPVDFSKNATTLLDPNPQIMELNYQTNPGTNYIASKMDETAINKIKTSISQKITKTYASTLFNQILSVRTGFENASEGANKIEEGGLLLANGNQTITDNLNLLANSSLTFNEGAKSLSIGLNDYTIGLSQVYDGATKLQAGIEQLSTNNDTLNNGVSTLSDGVSQLQTGSKTLLDGLNLMSESLGDALTPHQLQKMALLKENLPKLNEGIESLNNSLSDPNTLTTITTDLTAIGSNTQEASQNIAGMIQDLQNSPAFLGLDIQTQNTLLASLTTSPHLTNLKGNLNNVGTSLDQVNLHLTSLITTLKDNVEVIAQNANQLLPGSIQAIDSLTSGLSSVQSNLDKEDGIIAGSNSIYQGLTMINDKMKGANGLANGIQAYTNGVTTLKDGSDTLSSGIYTLTTNSPTLLNGTNQLSNGAQQINEGANQLTSGSMTLGESLSTLSSGANTLATSLADGSQQMSQMNPNEQTIDMFVSPVETKGSELSNVPNNGHAMAPYMMSVGLYVACIAFCLMYPLGKAATKKVESSFKWAISKISVMVVVGSLQAVLMIIMLIIINKLNPIQLLPTFLMASLVSITFMSMIVFFNLILGKVGSFIVLVFMVLQLGGAAGTYPIELSSSFYQTIHPFMPFTYSVHAFRNTLCIGGNIAQDILVFISILVFFIGLILVVYQYKTKKLLITKEA